LSESISQLLEVWTVEDARIPLVNADDGCALNRSPIIQAILSRRGIAGPDNLTGEGSRHLPWSGANCPLSKTDKELGKLFATTPMQIAGMPVAIPQKEEFLDTTMLAKRGETAQQLSTTKGFDSQRSKAYED
jgi:hypothetical protein